MEIQTELSTPTISNETKATAPYGPMAHGMFTGSGKERFLDSKGKVPERKVSRRKGSQEG